MEESCQPPSFSLPIQQLLVELEAFVAAESQRQKHPWVSSAVITAWFYQKYGVPPEDVANAQCYSSNLRSLLKNSNCFSLYNTQNVQEFYVALLKEIVPTSPLSSAELIVATQQAKELVRRVRFVSGRVSASTPKKNLEYQPHLITEIKSVDNLKFVLTEIVRSLTGNNLANSVTISTLSRAFCTHYGYPIRPVLRSVCSGIRLIELLQAVPSLNVQKIGDSWHIAVRPHSSE